MGCGTEEAGRFAVLKGGRAKFGDLGTREQDEPRRDYASKVLEFRGALA
jgi:hypothetical protein